MVKEDRRKAKREQKRLRMVVVVDPNTGERSTHAQRDADRTDPTAKVAPLPPEFFPEQPLTLDHWALPKDLRLSRREANLGGLRFYLSNASFTECCRSDRIVPLADLVCAAADVCSAASAQWECEQQDLVDFVTGQTFAPVRSGLAEYALRKSERDLWRQRIRAMTGPLELGQQRKVDALDDADLWQLLMQLDLALSSYRDAGGT